MTLQDTVAQTIEAYPEWSPAERRKLPAITEEILHYLRTGEGNPFIRQWCAQQFPTLTREDA